MADYRLPGPVCASQQTLLTDNGSLPRDAGCPRGPVLGADAGHASDLDPRLLWRRGEALREACAIGLARAPAAIVRETGLDDLPALAHGILEGALAMLAVVGVSSLVGGAAGGAVGALFGGIGAAPGAVAGAQLGMDAGVAVLGWLGLAFLAVAIGRGLGEISGMVVRAVGQAWDAEGTSRREQDIDAAGQLLADAIGRLMLLIVMAVVARLAASQAAGATGRASASAEELYAALRRSRLGAGFADWVKANAERLLRDPRLRRYKEMPGTGAKGREASTPSKLREPSTLSPSTSPVSSPRARDKLATNEAVLGSKVQLVEYPRPQLQHGFKHAKDFGIGGTPTNETLSQFKSALKRHVEAPGTVMVQGTYRSNVVTHFVDPNTGLNVIRDSSGNFLSGWKLSPQQLDHVMKTGKLGGGR